MLVGWVMDRAPKLTAAEDVLDAGAIWQLPAEQGALSGHPPSSTELFEALRGGGQELIA